MCRNVGERSPLCTFITPRARVSRQLKRLLLCSDAELHICFGDRLRWWCVLSRPCFVLSIFPGKCRSEMQIPVMAWKSDKDRAMRALKEFRICRGFFVFIFIFSIQCFYENALFVVGSTEWLLFILVLLSLSIIFFSVLPWTTLSFNDWKRIDTLIGCCYIFCKLSTALVLGFIRDWVNKRKCSTYWKYVYSANFLCTKFVE